MQDVAGITGYNGYRKSEINTSITTAVMEKLNSLYFVRVKVWRGRLSNNEFSKELFFICPKTTTLISYVLNLRHPLLL